MFAKMIFQSILNSVHIYWYCLFVQELVIVQGNKHLFSSWYHGGGGGGGEILNDTFLPSTFSLTTETYL